MRRGREEGRTSGSEGKRRNRVLGEREREVAKDLGEEKNRKLQTRNKKGRKATRTRERKEPREKGEERGLRKKEEFGTKVGE